MAKLKTKMVLIKVHGSTVVEVIVALVIIMVVFGIATMTYVRIIYSSSNRELHLQQQLMVLASEAENGSTDLDDVSFELEHDIQVQQKVTPYGPSGQLLLLELEAFDKQEKSLSSYRKIVHRKSDETP